MKKFSLLFLSFLLLSLSMLVAQEKNDKAIYIEFGGNYGITFIGKSPSAFSYSYEWGDYYNYYFYEEGGAAYQLKNTPKIFGGRINVVSKSGIGFQFAVDMISKTNITGVSTYSVTGLDLIDPYWEYVEEEKNFTLDGSVSMTIISFDLIYKPQYRISPWIALGGSYLNGKYEQRTKVGYGFLDSWGDFEYICPDIEINEKVSGFGFNVAAGIDFKISENIAFCIEAKRFFLTKKNFYWKAKPGTYAQQRWGGSVTLSDLVADYIESQLIPNYVNFNFSLSKISAGIRLIF